MFDPGWVTAITVVIINIAAAGTAYGILLNNSKNQDKKIEKLEEKAHNTPCTSIAVLQGKLDVIDTNVSWIKEEIKNNGFSKT